MAAPARCLRCAADLSRLPEAARYCPRCGLDTFAGPPAAVVARAAELGISGRTSGEWGHVAELFGGAAPPVDPYSVRGPQAASVVLQGYANALYNLGRRYERGAGTARNLPEAIRCYQKSARLGNIWALARLAGRWMAELRHRDTAPADAIPLPPISEQTLN